MKQRLEPIAKKLGITQLLGKYPYEVSGGQKQRAAVARALITNPKLVLADEPTGNLDEDTAKDIVDIFKRLAHEQDKCVIVVTHSKEVADEADEVVFLKNGKIET